MLFCALFSPLTLGSSIFLPPPFLLFFFSSISSSPTLPFPSALFSPPLPLFFLILSATCGGVAIATMGGDMCCRQAGNGREGWEEYKEEPHRALCSCSLPLRRKKQHLIPPCRSCRSSFLLLFSSSELHPSVRFFFSPVFAKG